MKPREIRELTDVELSEKIADQAEELANFKFQMALHQLDNTSKVRQARRELARLKTIEAERERQTKETTVVSSEKESA